MASEPVDGFWLEKYLEPQLLKEFRNYKDDFIGFLRKAPEKAIDSDGIKFNKLINNVGFYVNKTGEFVPKKMDGQKSFVEYDKWDTSPTDVTDKELRGLTFNKEDEVRKAHNSSFKRGVRDYVLHKLAPKKHAKAMPVLTTTGEDDGTGRKRLTYKDLLKFWGKIKLLNLPMDDEWCLVLTVEHVLDLIEDKASTQNNRDINVDPNTGKLTRFYNVRLFENNDCPYYNTSGELKAFRSEPIEGDQKASVFFYAPNTVYHVEKVTVLKKDMRTDTRSEDPTSEMRLHCYGLCDKRQDYGFGALVSGYNPPKL